MKEYNLSIGEYFSKHLRKNFNFHSNLTRITSTLNEVQYALMIISRSIITMRNVSDKFLEKIKDTFYIQ